MYIVCIWVVFLFNKIEVILVERVTGRSYLSFLKNTKVLFLQYAFSPCENSFCDKSLSKWAHGERVYALFCTTWEKVVNRSKKVH